MGVIVSECAFSTIIRARKCLRGCYSAWVWFLCHHYRLESVCVGVIVLGCGFSVIIRGVGVFSWFSVVHGYTVILGGRNCVCVL